MGLSNDVFSQNNIIKMYFKNGGELYALKVFDRLQDKELGEYIHCFVLKVGMETNPFVGSSILNMYAKLGDIEDAERVFECMDNHVGCWNAMIGGYAQCGYGFESLVAVSLKQYKGIPMDAFTFINALKGCLIGGNLNFGRQIHGLIIQSEVAFSTTVMNSLMDMH